MPESAARLPETVRLEAATSEPEAVTLPTMLTFPALPCGSLITVKEPWIRTLSAVVNTSKGMIHSLYGIPLVPIKRIPDQDLRLKAANHDLGPVNYVAGAMHRKGHSKRTLIEKDDGLTRETAHRHDKPGNVASRCELVAGIAGRYRERCIIGHGLYSGSKIDLKAN